MLKAIIFDMDGVIIDSEPMHAKAAVLALKKYNIDITTDYIRPFIGSTTLAMCKAMVQDFQLNISPEELLETNNDCKALLLKDEGYPVIPYVVDLIKNLHENGMKLIIASSSLPYAIEKVMADLNVTDYFQGYASGSMVEHPKPAPDIFLLAADQLGVKPEECLVIEDSHHGVTAATAAGMVCIGYVNPNSGNQDLSKATMLVEGFDEVDYDFIKKVYQIAHMEPAEILTTDHFILRELAEEDCEALFKICSTPGIKDYIEEFSGSLSEERFKLKAYIKNIYHIYGFGLWGVYDKKSQNLAGRCGIELKMIDNEVVHEIGYFLDLPYQGLGLGQEIVRAVLQHCNKNLGVDRIVALIDKNNSKSIRLATQVGMSLIGETDRNNQCYHKYEITFDGH